MSRRLKVAVLRDRYPTKFNTPRISRHAIRPVYFLPTNKIAARLEGVTLALTGNADLLHFHNRIPLFGRTPFLMSFESHLPRYFGGEKTPLFQFMRRRLAGRNCRRIIAMSHFAKKIFLNQHKDTPDYERLKDKVEIVYPNILLPDYRLGPKEKPLPLKLVFVGAHFGRKGGAVAARAAAIARTKKLPLHFHIISSLEVGSAVWTDPTQKDFFAPYIRLLNADNVTFERGASNAKVLEILRDADFSILTTFSDTFGYSVIESFGVGTPAIATPQGALPEFVTPGQNGIMIKLDVDEFGEWKHISRTDKDSDAYADLVRTEIERMAQELITAVSPYCDNPQALLPLRAEARKTAEKLFDGAKRASYLDDLYERCATN
jgi:glycosyltransferase involved in cell wall biosynthesis